MGNAAKNVNKILDMAKSGELDFIQDSTTLNSLIRISRNIELKATLSKWVKTKLGQHSRPTLQYLSKSKVDPKDSGFETVIRILVEGFFKSGMLEETRAKGNLKGGFTTTKKERWVFKIIKFIFAKIFQGIGWVLKWLWDVFWSLPLLIKVIAILALFIWGMVKIKDLRNQKIESLPAEAAAPEETLGEKAPGEEELLGIFVDESAEEWPEHTIVNGCAYTNPNTGKVDATATVRASCERDTEGNLPPVIDNIKMGTEIRVLSRITDNWYDFNEGVPGCGSVQRLMVQYINQSGQKTEGCMHASKAEGWDE